MADSKIGAGLKGAEKTGIGNYTYLGRPQQRRQTLFLGGLLSQFLNRQVRQDRQERKEGGGESSCFYTLVPWRSWRPWRFFLTLQFSWPCFQGFSFFQSRQGASKTSPKRKQGFSGIFLASASG